MPIHGVISAEVYVPCAAAVFAATQAWLEDLGFLVERIMPADSPSLVTLAGHGCRLQLTRVDGEIPSTPLRLTLRYDGLPTLQAGTELVAPNGVVVTLVDNDPPITLPNDAAMPADVMITYGIEKLGGEGWSTGRAGLLYRDLIDGRLGGRMIASHIYIPNDGPVPDYVHYHLVKLQLIFVISGSVDVVYEGAGAPFTMNAGDCVLQPPRIRHRVLATRNGAQVLEVACPASHVTFADRDLALPQAVEDSSRRYEGGQRFVFTRAPPADAGHWAMDTHGVGFRSRDVGIMAASNGLADVRVVEALPGAERDVLVLRGRASPSGEEPTCVFYFVLSGGAMSPWSSVYPTTSLTARTDEAASLYGTPGAPYSSQQPEVDARAGFAGVIPRGRALHYARTTDNLRIFELSFYPSS